jgi:hypothetical protein
MSRKAGWYWVKDGGQWEPLWFNGEMWDGHHHDAEIREIGPRIPTPDEPWDIVPAVPTDTMIEVGELAQSAFSTWMGMKAAAPKPEDV